MPDLTQYDLGQLGVNVDSSPIHKLDGELARAQNAIRNPLGVDGGITNRGGFSNLNGTATEASVLGGIGVPLGDGPGATSSERFVFSSHDNGGPSYAGWAQSDDQLTTVTLLTTPASRVPSTYAGPSGTLSVANYHLCCVLGRRLFYVPNFTSGSESVPIRVFNGVRDYELARLQPTTTLGITSMQVSQGTIYLTTHDSGTDDTNFIGRVFSLDPDTGHLTQIGPALATGYYPLCVELFQNDLFVGTGRLTTTNEAKVYKIRPGVDAAWTDDETMAADRYAVTGLKSWNGYLYVATCSAIAVAAAILRRDLAGTYTAVKTFTAGAAVVSITVPLVLFRDKLWTQMVNDSAEVGIWSSVNGTTWVRTVSTVGAPFVVSGTAMYTMLGNAAMKTVDGSTFTDIPDVGALAAGTPLDFTVAEVMGLLPPLAENS